MKKDFKYLSTYKEMFENTTNGDEQLENLKVKSVDVDKLLTDINKKIKEETGEGDEIKYDLRGGKLGIIQNPEGKYFVFDKELVGKLVDEGENIQLELYSVKYEEGVEKGFSFMPVYAIEMTIDELLEYVDEEVTVPEYMENRYNYNDRIKHNQYLLKEFMGLIN